MSELTKLRRAKYFDRPFEMWVALAAVVTAATFFLDPKSLNASVVSLALDHNWLVKAWNLLYGVGGLVTLVGLVRSSPRVEGAGLCFLTAGISVSSVAIIVLRGNPSVTSFALQFGAAVACVLRIKFLLKLERVTS